MEQSSKRYWFKNKSYGYGWTPATKEGWFAILVWFIAFSGVMLFFLPRMPDDPDLAPYFIPAALAPTLILLFVCHKTGEPLKWNWGKRDRKIE